jgi:hypothetical protein
MELWVYDPSAISDSKEVSAVLSVIWYGLLLSCGLGAIAAAYLLVRVVWWWSDDGR